MNRSSSQTSNQHAAFQPTPPPRPPLSPNRLLTTLTNQPLGLAWLDLASSRPVPSRIASPYDVSCLFLPCLALNRGQNLADDATKAEPLILQGARITTMTAISILSKVLLLGFNTTRVVDDERHARLVELVRDR